MAAPKYPNRTKLAHDRFQGAVPEGSFLVFYGDGLTATAVPIGARLGIVVDPTKHDPLARQLLVGVTRGGFVTRCLCNPKCHVVNTFKRTEEGQHSR
jgi:hypothetical protein